MSDAMIRAHELRVRYRSRVALDGLSFTVDGGEIVGLLGPNGAGKTTTLSILATLRQADEGTASVGGHSTVDASRAVRRALGYVPQSLAIYPTLTAGENLRFFARVLGLRGRAAHEESHRVAEDVGLADRCNDIVSTFSGGMQRRLNLACGLLRSPRVLLLDEPTVGVDPQSRARILTTIRAHAMSGAAVLYSTHYLEEAERICDRVLLIDHGKLIASDTPAALIRKWSRGFRLSLTTRRDLPDGWLAGLAGATPVDGLPKLTEPDATFTAHVRLVSPTLTSTVLERAAARGGEVLEMHMHQPSLQDVFLELTGRALRD